jgi:hypothetical protein
MDEITIRHPHDQNTVTFYAAEWIDGAQGHYVLRWELSGSPMRRTKSRKRGKERRESMAGSTCTFRSQGLRPVLRKNSVRPLLGSMTLSHPELCQAATSFLGLKMLLMAKAFSPDRIFADHRHETGENPQG